MSPSLVQRDYFFGERQICRTGIFFYSLMNTPMKTLNRVETCRKFNKFYTLKKIESHVSGLIGLITTRFVFFLMQKHVQCE